MDNSTTALSALQSGVQGLCEAHDASVSRRAFLKSLINGRVKDIGYETGGPSGGGNGNGSRRGYVGGSDGDGDFGTNESWGWSGLVLAGNQTNALLNLKLSCSLGTRGWVFIAAAITLVSSIFAQIFRSAGGPSSRSSGSISSTPSTPSQSTSPTADSDGVKLHLRKGGSLSSASSAPRFHSPKKTPRKDPTPLWSFALSEHSELWSRDEDSNELQYRGFLNGLVYPPLQAHSRAFYRKAVKKVGPKPGDWVETVEAEDEESYQLLNQTIASGNLDGVIPRAGSSCRAEPLPSEEEVYGLRDELKHVHRLLKRSETKRHNAIQKLKQNSSDFEEKELSLRTKIKTQEDSNQKVYFIVDFGFKQLSCFRFVKG